MTKKQASPRALFAYFTATALCLGLGLGAVAQSPVEYNNLGFKAYTDGRFDDAIAYFEKAYELKPGNPTVQKNLCNAHQEAAKHLADAGRLDDAASHLELAIGIAPDNPSPLIQLGACYLRMKLVADAIFRLEEAIELKPGELNAHELLGEAYYQDNDLPSARVQWDYVLEMDPKRRGLRERYEKAFREESVEQDFNRSLSGSRHFGLTYPKETPYTMRSTILKILERAYFDIGRTFGGVYPPGPIQVIIYSAGQFAEATQLDAHVGAVYDGKVRTPITDENGAFLSEDELKRRLVHEYVHVVVRYQAKENVPWWLNEGLAEHFSRELSSVEVQLLKRAYAQGLDFQLAALEGSQLKKLAPDVLRLAYAQSHATVSSLYNRFGRGRLLDLMAALAAGTPPEEACLRVYRKNYAAIEKDIARTYR